MVKMEFQITVSPKRLFRRNGFDWSIHALTGQGWWIRNHSKFREHGWKKTQDAALVEGREACEAVNAWRVQERRDERARRDATVKVVH